MSYTSCFRSVPRNLRLHASSPPELKEYDWYCAFTPAAEKGYDVDTIVSAVAMAPGENDGPSWVGIFVAQDGKFVVVSAGCDYTGWDCQSGGSAVICKTFEQALAHVDHSELVRLKLDKEAA